MNKITDKDGNVITFFNLIDKLINRIQQIALEFELLLLWFIGYIPLSFIRSFFYRLSGIKLGVGSVINMGARFYNPGNIYIGEDCILGEKITLDGRDKLEIGNHVNIASEVMIYNSQHDINDIFFKASNKPVEIEDYVFIGPRVIILPGVQIKKGAVVGAGAVVTKNVDEFSIVAGVPAVKVGERKNIQPKYRLRRKGILETIFGLF